MDALRRTIDGADSSKAMAAKASAKNTEVPARPERKSAKG